MWLYIEGHNVRKGWIISKAWSDEECSTLPPPTQEELSPVRFVASKEKAVKLIRRWNRRFAKYQ